MKNKIRFWGLYLSTIVIFIFRYLITRIIQLYEAKLWECFNPKAAWLGYLRNGVDVVYYLIICIIMILLCAEKEFKCGLEIIFFVFPASVFLFASVIMINPFIWVFTNSVYCIPFGAMLLHFYIGFMLIEFRKNNINI